MPKSDIYPAKPIKGFFNEIFFYHFSTSTPVTPADKHYLKSKEELLSLSENEKVKHDQIKAQIEEKHKSAKINHSYVDFKISGDMYIFSLPPISLEDNSCLNYLEGFSIFSSDREFFTRRSNYDSYLLLYTYEGEGLLDYEEKTYRLLPGMGFFIDCKKPHFYRTNNHTRWTYSTLHANGPFFPVIFSQFYQENNPIFYSPLGGLLQGLVENLLNLYKSFSIYRKWHVSDQLNHLFTCLLLEQRESFIANEKIPAVIVSVGRYLEQHFTSPLTLDDLSKFCGLSKFYLSREFQKYYHTSPMAYLILLRIDHAKYLLFTTNLTVRVIAELVGIHDLNNFSRLFKKNTGMTPGAFRKQR